MLIYSCTDGVSLGPGHCQLIMQPALTEADFEDMAPSLLLEWSRERGLSTREADCPLIRLAVLPAPEPQVFVCGRLGYIARIHPGALAEETIEGPHDQGFIRDLRAIGTHIYAAGM